ncbi:hypothetical protein F511_30205 [Dorcoceras hygrometricum]|uniref:Uncharacterized protein n=1 Tax=Dorcoceras hygrometricum TaxID=472368 RepID=A0A2Z7CC72_9LAMI|nr:hypothetical protein F511_30205 [Dorcoceras hygrometricum]
MGNTDPNNTKQENKFDVKTQYEELSKQLIMQHAINQCYERMRAIKDRIARPVHRNIPAATHNISCQFQATSSSDPYLNSSERWSKLSPADCWGTTMEDPDPASRDAAEKENFPVDDQYNSKSNTIRTIHRVFSLITLPATRSWLRPISRGNRHFTVGGGRLRQSGPRPKTISLRSACTRRLMDFITNGFSSSSWPKQIPAKQGGGGGGGV